MYCTWLAIPQASPDGQPHPDLSPPPASEADFERSEANESPVKGRRLDFLDEDEDSDDAPCIPPATQVVDTQLADTLVDGEDLFADAEEPQKAEANTCIIIHHT